jgi:hypothetical protein
VCSIAFGKFLSVHTCVGSGAHTNVQQKCVVARVHCPCASSVALACHAMPCHAMPCHAHRDRLLGRVTRAAVRLGDVRQHHLSSHSRPPAVTDVSRPLQSPRGSQCPPSRAFVMVNGSVGWSAGVTHKSTPGRSPSCQACRTRTAAACSKCTAGPCTSAPGSVTSPPTSGFARKAGKERSAYPFRRLRSVHAVHSLGERSQRS